MRSARDHAPSTSAAAPKRAAPYVETKAADWHAAKVEGRRLPEHEIPCEDCGEPATRETADGVWLCEGDFDALLDAAFWASETEQNP